MGLKDGVARQGRHRGITRRDVLTGVMQPDTREPEAETHTPNAQLTPLHHSQLTPPSPLTTNRLRQNPHERCRRSRGPVVAVDEDRQQRLFIIERSHMPDAHAREDVLGLEVQVESGGVHILGCFVPELQCCPGLVRRLVFREARVPVDPKYRPPGGARIRYEMITFFTTRGLQYWDVTGGTHELGPDTARTEPTDPRFRSS